MVKSKSMEVVQAVSGDLNEVKTGGGRLELRIIFTPE